MPQLKQPTTLKDAAMEVLVTVFANYFEKHSTEDSLDGIRTGVTVVKNMSIDMTRELDTEFCRRLIDKFLRSSGVSLESHMSAISEVIMDRKLIGLTCTYRLLDWFNPDDANRIIGLKELNLGRDMVHALKNFHLENLTDLRYKKNCTDSDLRLVAQNCKKLSRLDVSYSKKVTNVGLFALIQCTDLRYVDVSDCSVTHYGIYKFLSPNKSVREIICTENDDYEEMTPWFSHPQSVFPFIESFRVDCGDENSFPMIGVKFPNLKSLEINFNFCRDLEELKSLNKLSDIRIYESVGPCWRNVDKLVRSIGGNIKRLVLLNTDGGTCQRDLDLIFKYCVNLEYFEIDGFTAEHRLGKLVIPPFSRLKNLRCSSKDNCDLLIEYGEMPELEELALFGFCIGSEKIESMIFDHARFPTLKKLTVLTFEHRNDFNHLRQIARVNNLDIAIIEED